MVSFSELLTHGTCPQKHHYQYVMGYREPDTQQGGRGLGSLVHYGLSQVFSFNDAWAFAVNDKSMNMDYQSEDERQEAVRNANAVVAYHAPRIAALYDITAVEHEFEITVEGNKLHGTVDAVGYDRITGDMVLLDFKVRTAFGKTSAIELDLQLLLYSLAFPDVTRLVQYQMLQEAPKSPRFNQDGKPSQAPQKTTWTIWAEGVKAAGFDPADYEEGMRPKLTETFEAIVEIALDANVTEYAKEIIKLRIDSLQNVCYPVLTSTCGYCPFNKVCTARMYGYNWLSVLEKEFEHT